MLIAIYVTFSNAAKCRWKFDISRGLKVTCKTPQLSDEVLRRTYGVKGNETGLEVHIVVEGSKRRRKPAVVHNVTKETAEETKRAKKDSTIKAQSKRTKKVESEAEVEFEDEPVGWDDEEEVVEVIKKPPAMKPPAMKQVIEAEKSVACANTVAHDQEVLSVASGDAATRSVSAAGDGQQLSAQGLLAQFMQMLASSQSVPPPAAVQSVPQMRVQCESDPMMLYISAQFDVMAAQERARAKELQQRLEQQRLEHEVELQRMQNTQNQKHIMLLNMQFLMRK